MSLSVVLPCYNEEPNIERTIRDVASWMQNSSMDGQIVVTNDGSKDGSAAILTRLQKDLPNLVVVNHVKNQGYGAALRSGCDAATKDVIAFMDSDGQFHAEDIGKLLPEMSRFDFVTGIRARRADPFVRKVNAWLYGTLVRIVLGVRVTDLNCGLKMFRRSIWASIRPDHATGALFNAEVFLHLANTGKNWGEVVVPHYPRTAGAQTGANLAVIIRMFRELSALRYTISATTQTSRARGTSSKTEAV